MFFGVSRSVTECFQSVTDYLQPVTELGTPKNMAVALPGMTLQPHQKLLMDSLGAIREVVDILNVLCIKLRCI